MFSPLIPVMSGTNRRPFIVVTSFCLKSPPITDGSSVVWLNLVTASPTTSSLSPPDQYQSVSVLASSPAPPLHAAVPPRPTAAVASSAARIRSRRDRSISVLQGGDARASVGEYAALCATLQEFA